MRQRIVIAMLAQLYAIAACGSTSAVCAECHQQIYKSYSLTAMARSSGIAGEGPVSATFDKPGFTGSRSGFSYTAGRDETGYYFDFQKQGQHELTRRRRLGFYVGSGTAAIGFLIAVEGFLYEAPVTWYSRTNKWDFSPGFENYAYPFLTRAIVPRCLECHASGVQAIAGTQNGYASPPFLEGGIACARCHGPGDAHVSRMRSRSGATGNSSAIVNPVKLTPARRDSICAQCHVTGDVLIEKAGFEHQQFIPGNNLQDERTAFARVTETGQTRVTSHFENLSQSSCKRDSGDRLWCGTCHDPHSVPPPEQKRAYYRAKCLACHQDKDCLEKTSVRRAAADDCTGCHMPRNAAADARHVVLTDHSIPRRPATPSSQKTSPESPLFAIGVPRPRPRDLGLAYAIVAVREQNAVYAERAFPLLQTAIANNPNDGPVLSYLADLYKKRFDDATAEKLYQRLAIVDPLESSAPVALGAYAMEHGNTEEAIRLWREALRKSPALLLVRVNLAAALARTGRSAEARQILLKALEFHPGFTAATNLLQKLSP